MRTVEDAVQEPDLLRLREPLRRYLSRVVDDEQELDDLVQETLLRVWEVRSRVGRAAAASYAVATARNLLKTRDRALQVQQRHAHRLHEPPTVDGPEVEALRQEERAAAAAVLGTLHDDDLALLAPEDPSRAARERSARSRSRLARLRAQARVDYLLRLRRVELPTSRCRPVLAALSAGDRRQQDRAGAAEHLLTCPVCASCAPALLARERRLFGVVALPVLVLVEPLRRAFDRAPRTTSAVAAGALVLAAVAGGAALQQGGAPPVPAAAPAAAPLVVGVDDLTGRTGQAVVARAVLVREVPADEGFWVGEDGAVPAYVRLTPGSGESPVQVLPGARVSFRGAVRPLAPAAEAGLDEAEGLGLLRQQQTYLAVAPQDLVMQP